MRAIPPTLQAKLDSGATTLAHCWRIDPAEGPPMGFTDHDEDILFDGVVFEASSGFAAGTVEASLGLAADNASAAGALRSDRIAEADLRAGRYDGAEARLWLVDWTAPADRLLLFRGELGETKRGAVAFEAELRGLGERLNRPVCRRFLGICDARLGDGRCGVDLSAPGLRGAGEVVLVRAGRALLVSGLSGFAPGWFRDGALRWTSGALAGKRARAKGERRIDDLVELTLAATPFPAPAPGDGFEIDAGCDKSFAACREKFGNAVNFRGFPFVPGESWMMARPAEGAPHRGGARGRR